MSVALYTCALSGIVTVTSPLAVALARNSAPVVVRTVARATELTAAAPASVETRTTKEGAFVLHGVARNAALVGGAIFFCPRAQEDGLGAASFALVGEEEKS